MFSRIVKAFALVLPLSIAGVPALAGEEAAEAVAPVAKLQQVTGTVEHSKNGETWRPVTRTRYLFPGAQVRTGADGSAVIVNQSSGESQTIAANSEVEITATGPVAKKGKLSSAADSGGSFFQAMTNKFMKAQRYTTVRRSVDKDRAVKVATPSEITVSSAYPELVWENVGAEYAYRLTIDGKAYEVPVASTAEMVRFRLPELSAGEHEYMVEIVLNGAVVFTPKGPSTLTWLDKEANDRYLATEKELVANSNGDEFVIGAFREEQGFLVPAMDTYREYFSANSDDNEMRPMLIKAYNDLRLYDLKEKEAIAYNSVLAQGG